VEACRRILQDHPNIKIIALSGYNDSLIPGQLLKLGAMGFLSKNSPVEEMVEAIHQVMLGEPYLGKDVVENISTQNSQQPKNNPFAQLSTREMQVANLILQGQSIQEMAEILKLSDKTVKTYRYRLYEKLNVKNDVELTRLAVKWNYGGAS
jgi:two-component system invasion response regulator UvrY